MPLINFSTFQPESHPWFQNHPRFARLIRDSRSGIESSITAASTYYRRLNRFKRFMLIVSGIVLLVVMILGVVFHKKLLTLLVSFSDIIKDSKYGQLIILAMVVFVSIPPFLGYSLTSSLCGMAYGFKGWPLLAAATVIGSSIGFLLSRYLMRKQSQKLGENPKFRALTSTMSDEGLTLLVMIRLCPLPYSMSNGALASIPSVSLWKFALATAITTPKLFMHIFVGDRLVRLNEKSDWTEKILNVVSILIAVGIGSLTAYIMYIRTVERVERDSAENYVELEAQAEQTDGISEERDSFDIESDNDEFSSIKDQRK